MNALIATVICTIIVLIAIPTISFFYDAIPAIARYFKSWIKWITYKED